WQRIMLSSSEVSIPIEIGRAAPYDPGGASSGFPCAIQTGWLVSASRRALPEGRLTNRWSAAMGNTTYIWDDVGNLLTIKYPRDTNSFSYDILNRLTNMVDSVGTTKFSWTAGDQL